MKKIEKQFDFIVKCFLPTVFVITDIKQFHGDKNIDVVMLQKGSIT